MRKTFGGLPDFATTCRRDPRGSAASRRSELVSLDVEDVSETADGLIIRVRRSKADPEAQGISVALPYDLTAPTCPVRSYRAWIAVGSEGGPVFRSVDRRACQRWTDERGICGAFDQARCSS